MRKYIEKFLVLFNRLQSELNNSLNNLKWLPSEKPEIAELCYQLDEIYKELNRRFANQSNKYTKVPQTFQKRWEEYKKYYQKRIEEVARPIKDKSDKEFIELLMNSSEGDNEAEKLENIYNKLFSDLPVGVTFNPIEDNASLLVDELFVIIHDIVSNNILPDVFTDKHIGAFKYFTNTIGINFEKINTRWKMAPHLFISENINISNEKLVELYNEAVKSYIFGLNVSAIAMCRALLEHILIRYYKLEKDDLVKIVSIAEKKYKKLESLKLHNLRKAGNDVMHEYEIKSKIEDEVVVRYLLTIRSLVDLIPNK